MPIDLPPVLTKSTLVKTLTCILLALVVVDFARFVYNLGLNNCCFNYSYNIFTILCNFKFSLSYQHNYTFKIFFLNASDIWKILLQNKRITLK